MFDQTVDISQMPIGAHVGGKHGEIVMCMHCEKPACFLRRNVKGNKVTFTYAHAIHFASGGYAWIRRCRWSDARWP